jgi:hypothetical protein
MACALPGTASRTTKPTATPTQNGPVLPVSSGGSNGGNNGGNNGGTGNNGGNNGGKGSNSGNNGDTGGNVDSPTELPSINFGPYVVKQIETLGGESISGSVCSLTQPFGVLSNTPHVAFTFNFVPQDAQHGTVSYTYSIPKAGESHDAAGTYSLIPVDKVGTLQLSLSVSDHVVFKGFDGNIPNKYKFNLVPSDNTTCQPTP